MKTTKASTIKSGNDKHKSKETSEGYKITKQLIKQYKPYLDYLSKR